MSVNPDQPPEISPEELAEQTALYTPFTQAVRELVDATIRTTVDAETIRQAQREVEAITARLREQQINGSIGAHFGHGRARQPWGNTVVGVRNPVAPPVHAVREGDREGEVRAEVVLGAAYEGPPGLVHGGVSAMLLDQMLGNAAAAARKPGMTGYLHTTYRRPTPLGPLRLEAWVERSEGPKTWAHGRIIGPEGTTVEAEGLFILPRWARDLLAQRSATDAPPSMFGEQG